MMDLVKILGGLALGCALAVTVVMGLGIENCLLAGAIGFTCSYAGATAGCLWTL
jgi:hypothetical protein